jgi:hypothetical protein
VSKYVNELKEEVHGDAARLERKWDVWRGGLIVVIWLVEKV